MRLHHLTMAAFGPFAGVENVDFDELCDAGLFLLTGPTGAGKTTVLDAVCFALYGSVPGVRGVKALKSQHAPDEARPEVVLDFSVRDRRFVVRRSPEWIRPKRRGSGFTSENATATLIEKTHGEDHLLSSRAQEVGHFIGELIGMQSTQFVQVALLPQGDFQKFLRASSQDRHDVLQHLFRTDRYSRIEEWVHDHSRSLKERCATGESGVVRVLDTIAERTGTQPPEEFDQALSWADGLIDEAATALTAVRDQHTAASTSWAEARSRHDEALRVRSLIERRDQARATLADLARDNADESEARWLVDADERASRCLPLLRMYDEALAGREETERAWARALQRLEALDLGRTLPEPLTADDLADLERHIQARATRLEALLPREHELRDARRTLADAETDLAEASAAHANATERLEAVPVAVEQARTQAQAVAAVAVRADALTLQLAQSRQRLVAAREAERCEASLHGLREAARDARDRAADARERVQDLTDRRLAGIAAELAGQLAEGEACQVCGSTEHPAPAKPSTAVVTETEQAEAAAAYESRNAEYAAASGEVLQAEQRLQGLREAAAQLPRDEAAAEVERHETGLLEAQEAQARLEAAESAVARLTAEQEELTAAVHDLATRVATLTQTTETLRRTIETLTAEIADAADNDAPLTDEVARLSSMAGFLGQARQALCDHDSCLARADELESHALASALEHDFEDLATLRAAVLQRPERERLEALVESRAQASARARAVLEDDDVRVLEGQEAPDVAALAAEQASAEQQETAVARVRHQREDVAEALARQRVRLERAISQWRPVREEYLRADSMSKLVRGMGADNQLQMRLSAYVLATRLDQVVAAANERLAHMRDQRYLLQRTGRAARKGTQAGLGLEVVDQWAGDVRDPSTLSGGETFVVSLALALGLADVVTQEAGGTEIETLFVDEGFGTLDPDTLDDVMDRLDDLRTGGRAVGVVSHVSELRNRIPTQLHVEKRRNGSVVAVRTAVG